MQNRSVIHTFIRIAQAWGQTLAANAPKRSHTPSGSGVCGTQPRCLEELCVQSLDTLLAQPPTHKHTRSLPAIEKSGFKLTPQKDLHGLICKGQTLKNKKRSQTPVNLVIIYHTVKIRLVKLCKSS